MACIKQPVDRGRVRDQIIIGKPKVIVSGNMIADLVHQPVQGGPFRAFGIVADLALIAEYLRIVTVIIDDNIPVTLFRLSQPTGVKRGVASANNNQIFAVGRCGG